VAATVDGNGTLSSDSRVAPMMEEVTVTPAGNRVHLSLFITIINSEERAHKTTKEAYTWKSGLHEVSVQSKMESGQAKQKKVLTRGQNRH
jgi:hypothetical protein